MKKALKLSLILLISVFICACIISCGNKDSGPNTDIGTVGFKFDENIYKTTVEKEIESFDLYSKITISDEASVIFSKSNSFSSIIDGRSISINPGDNLIYVKVSDDNGYEKVYTFNIYRKQVFTVEFDTDGGTPIEDVNVNEGTIIEAPSTVKSGYTLGWDFDFSKPITSNITIKAVWIPNDYGITIENDKETTVVAVKYGEDYDLQEYEPEKAGYRFKGWNAVYVEDNSTIKVPFNGADKYSYASNITIVPVFEPVKYSITYVVELGATNPNTKLDFTVEEVVELLDATWKDDEKVFAGWYTSSDYALESKVEAISNQIGSITLWAKFDDVVFTTDVGCYVDEEPFESKQFIYKSPYTLTAPATEKGYAFVGWYYGETKLEMSGIWPYKDTEITLIASIVEIENVIIYDLPDGATNGENPSEYTVGMGEHELKDPSFGKHEFVGWFADPEFKNQITVLNVDNASDGMIIYSKWNYVSDVEFILNDGELESASERYIYGQEYELPIPVKSGNLFGGWYDNNGERVANSGVWNYKQDISLEAQWVPTTIAVNYELNGGVQNELNPVSFGVFTGIIQLYSPTKNDLVFAGWYIDSNYQNQITEIDTAVVREITLYAKWIEEDIAITYDANGGSVSKAGETIIYGTPYYLVTPELLGYKFEGWYYNNNLVPNSGNWSIASSEVNLVAHWSLETYSIEYNLGGATVDGLITEYNVNSDEIILSKISWEGHIFLGWKPVGSEDKYQTITITKGSTGNRSYEAVWCEDTDTKGFRYELRDDHMVCIEYVRKVDATKITYMPSEYFGYPVTGITSNAFSDFGAAFGASEYKDKDYYYTICIPQSITVIETDAFAGCNGICVQLYKEDKSLIDSTKAADLAELLVWEEKVTYSTGASNKQVRDCIWGFRPAIGWSRYSAVEIPDYYE